MVFPWSLSERKFPQVSRTLLSILADLNNAIVWMDSTRPPNSSSFRSLTLPLGTVPRAPITMGITVTFMFHNFLVRRQGSSTCFFSFFFDFHSGAFYGGGSLLFSKSLFYSLIYLFLLNITRSVLWSVLGDVFVSQNLYYYYYYYCCCFCSHLRVFHISISWWFSTDVWR